jgi:hypothetical protein
MDGALDDHAVAKIQGSLLARPQLDKSLAIFLEVLNDELSVIIHGAIIQMFPGS